MSPVVSIVVFWDVMLCGLVDSYKHFVGTCCLHLQSKRLPWKCEVQIPPKCWYLPIRLHGATSREIIILVLIAMRTSNPASGNALINFLASVYLCNGEKVKFWCGGSYEMDSTISRGWMMVTGDRGDLQPNMVWTVTEAYNSSFSASFRQEFVHKQLSLPYSANEGGANLSHELTTCWHINVLILAILHDVNHVYYIKFNLFCFCV